MALANDGALLTALPLCVSICRRESMGDRCAPQRSHYEPMPRMLINDACGSGSATPFCLYTCDSGPCLCQAAPTRTLCMMMCGPTTSAIPHGSGKPSRESTGR